MSRYFARLMQRAAGVQQKTQAAPPPSSAPAGSAVHDPFETVAPLEPGPASPLQETPPAEHPESTAPRAPAELRDLSTPAMAPTLPQPVRLAARAEGPVNPQPIQPQLAPRAEAPAPAREAQSLEQRQPAEVVERTSIERETVREIVHHVSDKPLKPVLLPAPPNRVTPASEKTPAPPAMPVLVQQPTGPVLERVAPEPRPALEPSNMARDPRPAPGPAPRQEPRLVIGRMEVEVIPSAPVPVAQPRVMHRRPAAPRASSAPSQLHFGLGQM